MVPLALGVIHTRPGSTHVRPWHLVCGGAQKQASLRGFENNHVHMIFEKLLTLKAIQRSCKEAAMGCQGSGMPQRRRALENKHGLPERREKFLRRGKSLGEGQEDSASVTVTGNSFSLSRSKSVDGEDRENDMPTCTALPCVP